MGTTTSRSERRRRRGLALLAASVALGLAQPSCADRSRGAPDAAVQAAELPPVPKPADLIATFVVGKPGDTWAKLREAGGGPARLLPQSFGLLVATLLGLPPAAAEAVDADVTMTGAATSDEQGGVQLALAVHVRSGRELLARLSAGADAPYTAREDAASGITLLEPRAGKASSAVALGITGNYLLASRRPGDLTKVGPYAARTLPKEPPPKHAVTLALEKRALAGPLAALVRDAWRQKKAELEKLDDDNRQKHGGRAPDFGDPRAALAGLSAAVEAFVSVLSSSAAGRVVVEPHADRVEVVAELDAEPQGAAAETFAAFTVGDAAPRAELPAPVPIAILTRTTAASRQAAAKSLGGGIGALLADRLAAPDREKIGAVLTTLSQGRGDWESYGVFLENGKGGLLYRAAVSDAKAFDAGAKDLFKLLSVKALAEPIRQFVGETTVKQSTAEVPGVPGKTQRVLIGLKPSPMRAVGDRTGKAGTESQSLELLWVHRDARVLGAGSLDAVPILGALVGAESDPKLSHRGDARVAAALARVKDASFVVLVQPLRLASTVTSTPNAPLVVSLGRRERTGFLRAEADSAALESVLKSLVLGR